MALARDVDLLIHDAQYTAEELPALAYQGHSCRSTRSHWRTKPVLARYACSIILPGAPTPRSMRSRLASRRLRFP